MDTPHRASGHLHSVAMLGNHAPRHCGIATFTADLSAAVARERPDLDCFVVAMNDVGKSYAYPERVRFEVAEADLASYRRAGDFLNVNAVDVLSVQHEYGIFGGKAGAHLLTLLRDVRMPIVTTLHTILAAPDPSQRAVMDELTRLSDRLVVMSSDGAELLASVHGVPASKVHLVPHGIPSVPARSGLKERVGVAGRPMILTFGLLSPDKGIELVIEALPAILAKHPDAVYVVLGATHPHVRDRHGETYRLALQQRAEALGVAASVVFHDRFATNAELTEFLAAADLYITPYLKEEQITSGTLAYALGAGKAVISTPYRYAREMLADGRGVLVPWRSPSAIAEEVLALLGDDARRSAMEQRALEFSRGMTWPVVARGYLAIFDRVRDEWHSRQRSASRARSMARRSAQLPEADLTHVRLMTDDTGMLQHAIFAVPRYEDGYCLDDNARALLLTALLDDAGTEAPSSLRVLATRYLAFVRHAFDPGTRRFRNFMSFGRAWLEAVGSEDSHGRAVWALGAVVGRSSDPGRQSLAGALLRDALPRTVEFTSPRAWAYVLLGIDEYLRAFQGDLGVQALRATLSARLDDILARAAKPDWPWFEDSLTYCNARLAQALLVSGSRIGDAAMTERGLGALEWVVTVQTAGDGSFAPVGSDGHYPRRGTKAPFDQQPVEVCATMSACFDAARVTGDTRWIDRAHRQFQWFLGDNALQRSVYDAATGGCRDGLHPDRVNENEGAESTLSFQLALVELRLATAAFAGAGWHPAATTSSSMSSEALS